jgi:hypothetical protein
MEIRLLAGFARPSAPAESKPTASWRSGAGPQVQFASDKLFGQCGTFNESAFSTSIAFRQAGSGTKTRFKSSSLDPRGLRAYRSTMKGRVSSSLLSGALSCALSVLVAPVPAQAQNISKTAKAGAHSITLKVLPAESFTGPHSEMTRDSGAEPNEISGPEHPNHHLVAFVEENGKPVENATVSISYREVSPEKGAWTSLPIVRMHVTGKGLETTHFGNNVKLDPGQYAVRVTVNASKPAVFRISLPK